MVHPSGTGEAIIRAMVAVRCCDSMLQTDPQSAVCQAIPLARSCPLSSTHADVGILACKIDSSRHVTGSGCNCGDTHGNESGRSSNASFSSCIQEGHIRTASDQDRSSSAPSSPEEATASTTSLDAASSDSSSSSIPSCCGFGSRHSHSPTQSEFQTSPESQSITTMTPASSPCCPECVSLELSWGHSSRCFGVGFFSSSLQGPQVCNRRVCADVSSCYRWHVILRLQSFVSVACVDWVPRHA